MFEGRGIQFVRVSDATVTGNTFDATMKEVENGVLEFNNVAERVVVANNTIRRRGVSGSAICVVHHSGGAGAHLVISDNVLTNDTAGHGVDMELVQDVTVSGNDLSWSVGASSFHGIRLRSGIRPAEGVMIQGNRIAGKLLSAVYLSASPQPFNAVSVVGNMSRGPVVGLRCDQTVAGNFTQPIVHAANRWDTSPMCSATSLVDLFP